MFKLIPLPLRKFFLLHFCIFIIKNNTFEEKNSVPTNEEDVNDCT